MPLLSLENEVMPIPSEESVSCLCYQPIPTSLLVVSLLALGKWGSAYAKDAMAPIGSMIRWALTHSWFQPNLTIDYFPLSGDIRAIKSRVERPKAKKKIKKWEYRIGGVRTNSLEKFHKNIIFFYFFTDFHSHRRFKNLLV